MSDSILIGMERIRYPPSDVRPTKRSKIEVACETCRLRKSRCDGARPKCSACMKRRNVGPYCIYSASSYSVPPAIHAPRLGIANVPVPQDNVTPLVPIGDSRLYNHHSPSQNQRPVFNSVTSTSSHSSTTTPGEDLQNPSNALDKDKDAKPDWILQAGLLAASSSAKFFKTVFGSSDCDEPQRDNLTLNEARSSIDQNSYHTSGASTAYDLPRRKVADALLHRFWTHVHIKWLDRAEFETWYQSLWASDTTTDDHVEEKIRYATLNMIFALVYRTEPDFEDDQDQLAQIHFGRAQELLHLNVLDLNHMSLLYALFLMLQWYQSVNDVKSCSSLIKLCLLIAQNLGLDDVKNVSTFNQTKREMARRAWHGCILMDRIIAMASGSPPRLPQNIAKQTPLFADIDDCYLTVTGDDGVQPPGTPSNQAFFLYFCKLHLILGDILVENHHTININHMIEIDRALHDFDEFLPNELRYGAAESRTLGQTIHLKTRYLYIQILLFRLCFTGLTESLKRGGGSGNTDSPRFSDIVMQQGILKCISAAQDLLNLLAIRHSAGERGPGLIPQWWHTVAYVYTAATVLIAAHVFPVVMQTHHAEDLAKSIQQAFSILDSYKRYREPAQRCRRALQILHGRYVGHETTQLLQSEATGVQSEVIDISWAWEGLPELFDDAGMFDLGFAGD